MEDNTFDPTAGKIVPVCLEEEMQKSYIDYAMSVIIQRALPDVRDGLKPVHRRILYAMQEAGMASNKPYKKSARIVGEVLGKFHPHGDSSVYEAIVRLAQDFSTRYLLVDGHGNFGSVDGDGAAAMRYTEVRMAKMAEVMLEDIEKDTVDFVPNYDESLKEPAVLPAKVPELLINGSSGIAVGMATNIPPHNLGEVINGLVMLIDDPDVEIQQLMTAIKGPDFPTGAIILGREGIENAYLSGRGTLKVRAKLHVEEIGKSGRHRIVVTEIPYQVNKAKMIEDIAEATRPKEKDKKPDIEGISDIRDESDRKGLRVVIELRGGISPELVLNQLYKHSQLQTTFGIIMLALVDGRPQILNLKEVLVHYLAHQKDVYTRRTRYELAKAKDRAHILEGLKIALDNMDAVIAVIRSSATADTARTALMERFGFSQRQAQAILDMRLQRLTGLERKKIEDEYVDVLGRIDYLEGLLADEHELMEVIKEDLLLMKSRYGDARRTTIEAADDEIDPEALIRQEEIVVTLSSKGYIKRQTLDNFRSQKRGGQGKKGGSGKKEDDASEHFFKASTHDDIFFFTAKGRVFRKKGYEIPDYGRNAQGNFIKNLLSLQDGEKITAIIPVGQHLKNEKAVEEQVLDFGEETDVEAKGPFLFMATKKGIVKKTDLQEFRNLRRTGMVAISLGKDDDLIGVELTDGEQEIVLASKKGMAIRFDESQVRPMGRSARGVKGFTLDKEDEVVALDSVADQDEEVLTVTERGLGKRTAVKAYRKQSRGGKGVINLRTNTKTGLVIGMKVIDPSQEIMVITDKGIILRVNCDEISKLSRATQGVKVITLAEGDRLANLAAIYHDQEQD